MRRQARTHRIRRPATAIALVAAAASLSGCFGPKFVRDSFYESRDLEIILRARTDRPGAYEHPAVVSSVRLAHILASIDVRLEEQKTKNARTPAVPVDLIYPLGEHLGRALAAAKPNQEIVVMAKSSSRTLKLFTEKRLTSFIAYMKNDQLHFHISRVDWPVPKNPNERIREPRRDKVYMEFKVLPSKSIIPVGRQAVAVEWRDPSFRRADAIRVGRGGKIKRRTVLMEMEEPESEAPEPAAGDAIDFSDLSPEALRALADLEEERRRGAIGEAEYRARRRKILEKPAP